MRIPNQRKLTSIDKCFLREFALRVLTNCLSVKSTSVFGMGLHLVRTETVDNPSAIQNRQGAIVRRSVWEIPK